MNTNESKIMSDEERQKLFAKIKVIDDEIVDLQDEIERSLIDGDIISEEQMDPEELYFSSQEGQIDLLYEEKQSLEERLYEDNYWRKNVQNTEIYNKSIEEYSVGNVISDASCDISKDVFKRKELAKTIADTLCNPETKGPFNIGILGKWGQGKTTFVEYIKESISENDNASRIRVIDYNASEYDEQEKIWGNLANRLFKEYEKDTWFTKIRFYISRAKRDFRVYEEKVILNILIIIGIFILTVISKGLFSVKKYCR